MKRLITLFLVSAAVALCATAIDVTINVTQPTNAAREFAMSKNSEGSDPMNVYSQMTVKFNNKDYTFKFDYYFVECMINPEDMDNVPIGAKITSIACDGEKINGRNDEVSADSLYLATYIKNDVDPASDPYIIGGYYDAKTYYEEEDLFGAMAQCSLSSEDGSTSQVIHSDFDISKPFEYTGNIFKVGLEIYAPDPVYFRYNTTSAANEVATTYHVDKFRTFDDVVFYYNAPYVQALEYMNIDVGMTFEPNKLPAFTLTYYTNDVRGKITGNSTDSVTVSLSDGENTLEMKVLPGDEFAFENVDYTKTYSLSIDGEVVAQDLTFEDITRDINIEIEMSNDNPVVYDEFYMLGDFNEWGLNGNEPLAMPVTQEEGIYEATTVIAKNGEFKFVTPDENAPEEARGYRWFGGVDEVPNGYFLIDAEQLNKPLTLLDNAGSNFRMEKPGKYTFRINAINLTLEVIPIEVPGDVNGDGVCNAADVTALYNWILNNDDNALVNGNQNGDDVINAGDVTTVYNIILGN